MMDDDALRDRDCNFLQDCKRRNLLDSMVCLCNLSKTLLCCVVIEFDGFVARALRDWGPEWMALIFFLFLWFMLR